MALLGRLFVITFAIFMAMLAAGIVIAMAMLGPQWQAFSGDIAERVGFWMLVFFGTSFTGAVGFLPVVTLIVLAEAFKVRSLIVHAAAGALLLVLGAYGAGPNPTGEESIDHPPPLVSRPLEIAAAGGAAFGFVYWLLAGRNAGRWRERRQPAA